MDLFDCSKDLLKNNIKVLEKHKKICESKIREINQIIASKIGDIEYLNSNKDSYTNLLINIEFSLRIAREFMASSGTDKEKLSCFYKSLYEIYLDEGNNW